MSAIATFTVLDRKHVAEFVTDPGAVLATHGTEHGACSWSGYVVMHLLEFLADERIDLMSSEHDATLAGLGDDEPLTVLLTPAHRRYLPALDPSALTDEQFKAFCDENGLELDLTEAGEAGRDTIGMLRDVIAGLSDDQVAVLRIG